MGLRTALGLKKPKSSPEILRARALANANYPATVQARAEPETVATIARLDCKCVAEFGILDGNTSIEIARILKARGGTLHIFDFEHNVERAVEHMRREGLTNVQGHGSSTKLLDSYNWPLSKVLEANASPIFDYAFIDGAHTWNVDALTFLLVDKLMVVGGHVDFDDYNWTLGGSPNLSPAAFPLTAECYTDEQIGDAQVKRVVDLLVKRDPRYVEVLPNKIYRKIA